MLSQRLSAWFGADHGAVVRDILAGKERILPLVPEVRRYPGRTLSTCHFAALNFVRVAFKHMRRARGNTSPSTARLLSAIMERHVLEEMLAPCQQLTSEQVIQLEEMHHLPLFENALVHVATKHGHPSMILFKQSLRQMQLHASPVSAMIVSRGAGATVCLKLREGFKDVFLVLNFAVTPPAHCHGHGTTLALVVSASLEQTAARLSGISPMDNHLLTRDRQWQAQLFTSCTICVFIPADRAVLPGAESSAINESIALLRVMGEMDDRGRDWERESDVNGGQSRNHHRQNNQPLASSRQETWERTPFNLGRDATTNRRHAGRVGLGSLGEGSSVRTADLQSKTTFLLYEQTKRHCRIFFSDDESSSSPSSSPSLISFSSEEPDEQSYFECVICFEKISEGEGMHLLPCAHGFCRDCLAGHVCSKLEERRFPIFCPLCMAEQSNASPSIVSGALVQRLEISEAQYAIWSELELAHLCVRVHCHRCNRSAFVDKEDYEQQDELRCPFPGCRHTWCKNCQQSLLSSSKTKHSCDGTEELDHLVRQMGWKYCPKCRTPVQKNGGCNHMTCATPGCNTHFCYRCGKQITRASIPLLVMSAVNAHFKQCTL